MSKSIRNLLIVAFLLAATFVVYWRALDNGFIVYYDDGDYVTLNPHVQTGINGDSLAWAFTTVHSANWHPVTWISHMVDFSLYRLMPTGHHLTNLLLHMANVLLLFFLLRRMTRSTWKSAFVAALFAVHPLHVESVAWIAERKDVLSTFFCLLTMMAYIGYSERPGIKRYALVVLAFALGLMSKPMLVTLPILLLLLDYWPLGRMSGGGVGSNRRPLGRLIVEKLPLFALSAASCVITYIAQKQSRAVGTLDVLPVGVRVSNAIVAYVNYICKMFWPVNLSVMYPHPDTSLAAWKIIGAAAFLAGMTFLASRSRRRHPYLLVGWLWYLVTLIPVIGLVQVGSQAMADRYTYIPLIGVFIMIAWGVSEGTRAWRHGTTAPEDRHPYALPLGVASLMIIAALMVCTYRQVGYWQDSIRLLQHAVTATTDNYDSYNSLGTALVAEGRYQEAIEDYQTALRICPRYATGHNNLGVALADLGKLDEAISRYRLAISIDSGFAQAHYNLGKALSAKGSLDTAADEYRESLRLEPDNADAHNNLGNLYLKQGKTDEAIQEYQEALHLNPSFAEARTNLDSAQAGRGKDPKLVALSTRHYNAGVALQMQDKNDEAIREYLQVVKLQPDNAQAHNNLALAYFDKGEFIAAWKEVHLCQKYGLDPHPQFIQALEEKMPEPRQ